MFPILSEPSLKASTAIIGFTSIIDFTEIFLLNNGIRSRLISKRSNERSALFFEPLLEALGGVIDTLLAINLGAGNNEKSRSPPNSKSNPVRSLNSLDAFDL